VQYFGGASKVFRLGNGLKDLDLAE
jgi:hypothetical protein